MSNTKKKRRLSPGCRNPLSSSAIYELPVLMTRAREREEMFWNTLESVHEGYVVKVKQALRAAAREQDAEASSRATHTQGADMKVIVKKKPAKCTFQAGCPLDHCECGTHDLQHACKPADDFQDPIRFYGRP